MPMAVSSFGSVTAKHTIVPAACCFNVAVMNRSNPLTVEGGGEMNLETSSVVSIANSDGASDGRSSRNRASSPLNVGSDCCQLVLATSETRRSTISVLSSVRQVMSVI